MVGFSDEYGSWKTPWICRRTLLAVSPRGSSMLDPRYRMSPPVGLYSPSSKRPKVVLPEPVSPTSASVSPRLIDSDTPSTAFNVARPRPIEPWPTLKCLVTSRVSMIGGSASDICMLLYMRSQPEPACARTAVDIEDGARDVCGVIGG